MDMRTKASQTVRNNPEFEEFVEELLEQAIALQSPITGVLDGEVVMVWP